MPERIVMALGGNALLRQEDRGTVEEQTARSPAADVVASTLETADRSRTWLQTT